MFQSAFFLATYAVFAWALFMYILKPSLGFSFVRTPVRTFSYFVFISLLLLVLFHPLPLSLLISYSWAPPATFVFAVLVVYPLIYREARSHIVRSAYAPHKDLELLELDYRFLFSKVADVLFQQLSFGVLVFLLAPQMPFAVLTLLCALLFFIGHVGLVFRMPHKWAGYFLVSAFFGGMALPFLLLFVTGGIYYAMTFHMFWYVLTGVLFRRTIS